MGVTLLPGAPQFGQGGGNNQNLVQLAMAVKSFKMQEKQQKKAEAASRVDMLMKNPQLLLMQDPKEMEKDLKELGIKVTDQQPTNPQDAAKTAPTAEGTAKVDPNQMATLASVTQGNKSGAQSASPASPGAANKAPGGGETGGIMSPQLVEQMGAKANQRLQENYGALAPIYQGARSQVESSQHQAQLQMEIDTLKRAAIGGDIRAMARLSSLAGHQVTDSDMRNMVVAAGASDKAVQQALDVALHNETGDSKASRFQAMSKDMLGNPQIMERLDNPLDVYKITNSIVFGGSLPEGVSMKPFTLEELKQEADYEKMVMQDQGLPYEFAHLVARGQQMKVSPSLLLPPGMQGLLNPDNPLNTTSLATRKVGAQEKQASAAALSAEAEMVKANTEHSKIAVTLAQKEYDALNDRIKLMIEADKAKKPWPDDIKQGYLNQLARATGLMPEEVSHWYKFGMTTEYKKIPASDLAETAAGRQPGVPKPVKRDKTFAEKGGVAGAVRRTLPKDAQGNPILNPFELERQLLTAGRERTLQYMKDIMLGTEEKPK